jgi:GNAT superfamily N-acetyltransferase
MIHVRPAEHGDADALAPRLRPADRREIEAALGMIPSVVLKRGVHASDPCYAVVADGVVLALFGVVPLARGQEIGVVWLLGAEDFAARTSFIVRASRPWIAKLHERYRVLTNYVDARNEVHHRWLRWCGFVFVRRIERFGALGLPFYEVRREREPSAAGAREPEGSRPENLK